MNFRNLIALCLLALGAPALGAADSAKTIASRFPVQYILDNIQGQVHVLSKGVMVPETAQEDQVVLAGDTIVTGPKSQVSLVLNAKTMVQVSENSQVTVGELSKKGSMGFFSRLKLSFGKVLSQVEKLATSHSTFEVEAGGVVCGVRGTAFEVSTEGTTILNSTFEGAVEMKTGSKTQTVAADHHSEYSGDRGEFLLQRVVTDRERERFQNWKKFQDLAIQRQKGREEALRSFEALQKPEREDLWEGLAKVRARDRFMILRRMMRENNLKDRHRILDESVRVRSNALRERENLRQRALEEREKNLRNKPKTE
jgi:hypothetical protein